MTRDVGVFAHKKTEVLVVNFQKRGKMSYVLRTGRYHNFSAAAIPYDVSRDTYTLVAPTTFFEWENE